MFKNSFNSLEKFQILSNFSKLVQDLLNFPRPLLKRGGDEKNQTHDNGKAKGRQTKFQHKAKKHDITNQFGRGRTSKKWKDNQTHHIGKAGAEGKQNSN